MGTINYKTSDYRQGMNTAIYNITDFFPHYYNVHILTNGIYYGVGKFFDTWADAVEFMKQYNVKEVKRG